MSLVLNMVGGGGGGSLKDTDAILTVTVPTGSTVTMTKGGVTLTPTMWVQAADPTLDCALFVIFPSLFDSQNAWTVTATLGTNTTSGTVTIDSNEQYNIKLIFGLLYNYGDTCTGLTGGWIAGSSNPNYTNTGSVSWGTDRVTVSNNFGGSYCIYTTNSINLTYFTSLKAIAYRAPNATDAFGILVATSFPTTSIVAVSNYSTSQISADPNNPTTITCDISTLTGNYKIGLGSFVYGTTYYKAWLE